MSDYGIKVSKPFFDALTAGDADLLFSSSWPSLPIVREVTVENASSYTHDLGFAPFFSVWQKGYQPLSPDYSELVPTGWSRIGMLYGDVLVNNTTITFPTAAKTHIKLYNIPIDRAKEYEFIRPSTSAVPYDPDYGIRIVKEGEDIDSTDLRDFILHSRAQSPLILSQVKATPDSTGGTATFTDPQGYEAWAFGFIKKSSGSWAIVPSFSQAYPSLGRTVSNGKYVYSVSYISAAGDTDAALMILRDPLFTANDVEAVY